jgi:CHRD domain
MTDEDIRAVAEGRVYVNVHTALHPNGEIRGQVLPTELYTAAIEAENVAPPVIGSDATGTAYLMITTFPGVGTFARSTAIVGSTFDEVEKVDIHKGAVGQNGHVIFSHTMESEGVWSFQVESTPPDEISPDDREAIRRGDAYIDAHTADFDTGEGRGQLIPSALNLVTSSAPIPVEAGGSASLTARLDARSNAIRFAIDGAPRGDRRIVLYSALGAITATVDADASAAIDAASLPNGIYIAQLLIDGRAVATCRVGVVR